jgi:hypothetical protein
MHLTNVTITYCGLPLLADELLIKTFTEINHPQTAICNHLTLEFTDVI